MVEATSFTDPINSRLASSGSAFSNLRPPQLQSSILQAHRAGHLAVVRRAEEGGRLGDVFRLDEGIDRREGADGAAQGGVAIHDATAQARIHKAGLFQTLESKRETRLPGKKNGEARLLHAFEVVAEDDGKPGGFRGLQSPAG